jgi:DNA invertase Pin-like site-specific DNA recombinase
VVDRIDSLLPAGHGHHADRCRQPDAFLDDTPTATMVRQILGVVSQFEKAALVAKLKGARDRKKAATGKCGGRKSYVERNPEMVALAKKLARYPVNGRQAC